MIVKTYARIFVDSLDDALPTLETLVGRLADLRFWADDPQLLDAVIDDVDAPPLGSGEVEQAAVGDFLVIAGAEAELVRVRRAVGPVVVRDLAEVTRRLVAVGARVAVPRTEVEVGAFNYLRHPDGTLVEYVEWKPDLVEKIAGRADGQWRP